MSAVVSSRGRVLSSQQVRFSDAPVRLGQQMRCHREESTVSIRTNPETGDITEIILQCGCGEVTVIECSYDVAAESEGGVADSKA